MNLFDSEQDPSKISPLKNRAAESEIKGIIKIQNYLANFHQDSRSKGLLIEDKINYKDTERTHDGFIQFHFNNNQFDNIVPVWSQVKSQKKWQGSWEITDKNILDYKARGIDTNTFVWLMTLRSEQKVYYRILNYNDYYKLIKSKDEKRYIEFDRKKFFQNDWETVNQFFTDWKREYYKIRQIDSDLEIPKKELSDYDKSLDKIKPILKSTIISRKEVSESNRVIDLLDKIIKIGNNPWTEDLTDTLKENPTLQSRFFEILESKDIKTINRAFKFVIPKLIHIITEKPKINFQDWKTARRLFLYILNKYNCENKNDNKVQEYYQNIILNLDINQYEDLEQLNLIFNGLNDVDEITSELRIKILEIIENIQSTNYPIFFSLSRFVSKHFYKYPRECTIIFSKIIQDSNMSSHGFDSDGQHIINEFFRKFPNEKKIEYKQYLIKLAVESLVKSANEDKSLDLNEHSIYKYESFPLHYLHFSKEDEIENDNISYFDFLWKLLKENFAPAEITNIFDTWFGSKNIYESLVFFAFRYSKMNDLAYDKIDLLLTEINKLDFGKWDKPPKQSFWLEEKEPYITTIHSGYVTEEMIVTEWQQKLPKTRDSYLNWGHQDWQKDVEFEIQNNQNSFDFSYNIEKVLKSYLIKSKLEIEELITFFASINYANNIELKNSYLLACVKILEESTILKIEQAKILIDQINSKNIVLSGELGKVILWFFEKSFEDIKMESTVVGNLYTIITSFLKEYVLEDKYQTNLNHQDIRIKKVKVTAGTIINTPTGVAFEILIFKLWYHYLNTEKDIEILEFIKSQFENNKPLVKDSILFCLGHSSKEILDKYWVKFIDNIVKESLKEDYDYGRFIFLLYIINRWLIKSVDYRNDLQKWVKVFLETFGEDERDEYLSACIHQIYAIEIWTGIFQKQLGSFKVLNDEVKYELSRTILSTAEKYRTFFKDKENKVFLEKRLFSYIDAAITFLNKHDLKKYKTDNFFRSIVYDYEETSKLEEYFEYWLSEDRKPYFIKILDMKEAYSYLYDPEFLKERYIVESKKLRNFAIEFLEIYLESKRKLEDIDLLAKKIIFIVKTDNLYLDPRVKNISEMLISISSLEKVIELSQILTENS